MKKLITYILLISPLLTMAQKDSVNFSYSEEKVESFEKTTLIDEYEKAFGNNRVVKTSFRIGYNGGAMISILPGQAPFTLGALFGGLIPAVQLEQKIDLDKSVIVSFKGDKDKQSVFWIANLGLEGRWYYQMKNRVKLKKQQPNITGKYISLRYNWLPYKTNPAHENTRLEWGMFQHTSSYSINWGWQFGNNANYGFSFGVKYGDVATINSENLWIGVNRSATKAATWFFTTNAQAGLGLYFPLKKRVASNYCDFLQCNYDVKQLLKINLNNALYLDKYLQLINLDIAYERKLMQSSFSVNSNIQAQLIGNRVYKSIGFKSDTIFVNGVPSVENYSTYANQMASYWIYSFKLREQLRYYPGMKKRIARGKSANNLNGTYVAALGQFGLLKSKNYTIDHVTTYMPGAGISVGHQIQTNRNSFLDLSANFIRQQLLIPALRGKRNESVIEFSLKLGFAR